MFLTELNITQAKHLIKNKWHKYGEVGEYLTSNGYKLTGHGGYSQVWSHPNTNSVVKVSRKEDRCWLVFADYVRRNKNNPHLPKISRVIRYQSKKPNAIPSVDHIRDPSVDTHYQAYSTLFIAFMEKLNPIKNQQYRPIEIMEELIYSYSELSDEFIASGCRFTEDFYESAKEYNSWREFRELAIDIEHDNQYKSIFETLFDIKVAFQNTGCKSDIHIGNVMVRPKTNEIVIMDPLFGNNE